MRLLGKVISSPFLTWFASSICYSKQLSAYGPGERERERENVRQRRGDILILD
jgi:hypothetical protein